jgi:tetratricopeptide (TPR) repeat protein
MILYRPVGLQEMALIYDSGMKAFPARLPQQPIFYPVFDLEYARQTASDWNVKNGQFAGYVTQFKVEDEYLGRFETHTVGASQYEELWIPAEKVEQFNRHIAGHIKVVEAYFGNRFEGFIPEKFSLQGKNAVEQFTQLANSFLYKRMEFYLEIRRNHKAVFLNYPFWLGYAFENPGLKEKVLQAIKEAWLTSFPQIPLPLPPPVQEGNPLATQTISDTEYFDEAEEEITPEEQDDFDSSEASVYGDRKPAKQTQAEAQNLVNPVPGPSAPNQPNDSQIPINPAQQGLTLPVEIQSHFVQGIKLGLSGQYREAIGELFKAVEEDPEHVAAHTSLGVAFHRLGEDDRALACYETALKVDPIHAEAHYFRANILYGRGSVPEAIAGYTVAIGLKPELIEAHRGPAPEDRLTDYSPSPAEMVRIAKPAHRILELNKSLDSNPGQAQLFKERAAEYYRLRNYVQAIADYSSALEVQPDDASALHSRGLAYEQLGQHDRARDDFQQAITLDPQLPHEYLQRGITFGKAGNFRQSIASLTEGIRLAPRNPDAYFNRGMSFFQLGDFESAIADFSRAIELASNDEDAYYWRGVCFEESGRQREAIADYRRFLTISRNPRARKEIEGKLRQWNAEKRDRASHRSIFSVGRQKTDPATRPSGKPEQDSDLYRLVAALGERATKSTWFSSGVECHGEKAEQLYALTDQPIEGRDFLEIASGIRQTIQGDFYALDPGAESHWLFLRAWEGNGFYIESNDLEVKERLKAQFPAAEEVEGASPSYNGLFIRI